jgi:hypothetical protein
MLYAHTHTWSQCYHECWLYEWGMPTETEHARRLPTTRAACDHMTLDRRSTHIARHRSYIELKFIKHFCLSCKILANKVTRNSRYHCIYKSRWTHNGVQKECLKQLLKVTLLIAFPFIFYCSLWDLPTLKKTLRPITDVMTSLYPSFLPCATVTIMNLSFETKSGLQALKVYRLAVLAFHVIVYTFVKLIF